MSDSEFYQLVAKEIRKGLSLAREASVVCGDMYNLRITRPRKIPTQAAETQANTTV